MSYPSPLSTIRPSGTPQAAAAGSVGHDPARRAADLARRANAMLADDGTPLQDLVRRAGEEQARAVFQRPGHAQSVEVGYDCIPRDRRLQVSEALAAAFLRDIAGTELGDDVRRGAADPAQALVELALSHLAVLRKPDELAPILVEQSRERARLLASDEHLYFIRPGAATEAVQQSEGYRSVARMIESGELDSPRDVANRLNALGIHDRDATNALYALLMARGPDPQDSAEAEAADLDELDARFLRLLRFDSTGQDLAQLLDSPQARALLSDEDKADYTMQWVQGLVRKSYRDGGGAAYDATAEKPAARIVLQRKGGEITPQQFSHYVTAVNEQRRASFGRLLQSLESSPTQAAQAGALAATLVQFWRTQGTLPADDAQRFSAGVEKALQQALRRLEAMQLELQQQPASDPPQDAR